MDKSTLLRYQGCINTASLFKTKVLPQIKQIELCHASTVLSENIEFKNDRLGKLVEEFVFYQLKQQPSVNWIVENIQIQKNRQTIGELDAIFNLDNKPIHLEVVYKFYLYDTLKNYKEPLSYWIGPNRKDSLCYKLNKLKTKQFPLLFKEATKHQLEAFSIDFNEIIQQVCFKAQLFLPYNSASINLFPLNDNCISGFFISYKDISTLKHLKFYIPKKLDWLIIPHNDVDWHTFEIAKKIIETHIEAKRSPLVWLKYSDSEIKKCFITFW